MTDDPPIGRSDLPGQPLPDDLATLLHTAIGWMHRRFRTAAPSEGLSYGAMTLINRLRIAGPQSIPALATWENVSEASIGQTAARLMEGGYVERDTDGSDTVFRATDRGARVSERWFSAAIGWVGGGLDRATEEERETLRRACDILIRIARS